MGLVQFVFILVFDACNVGQRSCTRWQMRNMPSSYLLPFLLMMCALGAAPQSASAQVVSTAPCWLCQWQTGTTVVAISPEYPSITSATITDDARRDANRTQVESEGLFWRGIDTWNREAGAAVRMKNAVVVP